MKPFVLPELILCVLFASVGISFSDAPNPHPLESCAWGDCHATDPTGDEVLLHEDSIDDTCCICHAEKCSLTEGSNHVSNINRWDWREFRRPKSLPLYNGYITCMTCHFRKKPIGPDYKMVRIVSLEGGRVNWEELCRDCHAHH